jgi:hydroxyisourate hydrolase
MTGSAFHRRSFLTSGVAGAALIGAPLVSSKAQGSGDLTAHALDATVGRPADGVVIDLFNVSDEQSRKVGQATTNADGRADLIAGRPLVVGRYELRFAVGDYFRKRGTPLGNPAFLDIIPIRIFLHDPAGHYHVPMIFTPWSYAMHG